MNHVFGFMNSGRSVSADLIVGRMVLPSSELDPFRTLGLGLACSRNIGMTTYHRYEVQQSVKGVE